MENSNELSEEQFWKNKIKEHRNAFIVAIIAGVCAAIGAIMVLFWFIQTSPIGLQGTATFNQWNLDWIVGFSILITLYELLFVGIPTGLFFGVGAYIWWKRLPGEARQQFKDREKKKKHRVRNAGGSGGGGFFMFIAYCIFVAMDGHYFTQFGAFGYGYWVGAAFLTFMWLLIIFGIPAAIILLIVYFAVWRKKSE